MIILQVDSFLGGEREEEEEAVEGLEEEEEGIDYFGESYYTITEVLIFLSCKIWLIELLDFYSFWPNYFLVKINVLFRIFLKDEQIGVIHPENWRILI